MATRTEYMQMYYRHLGIESTLNEDGSLTVYTNDILTGETFETVMRFN